MAKILPSIISYFEKSVMRKRNQSIMPVGICNGRGWTWKVTHASSVLCLLSHSLIGITVYFVVTSPKVLKCYKIIMLLNFHVRVFSYSKH